MQRIAIIGFGFSGLLLATHLVRQAKVGTEIYLIDPTLNARGMAYSTPYAEHLLNVRASNMSAFPDEKDHLVQWLAQHHAHYTSQDFVPRQIYGDYLESIWQDTQAVAAKNSIYLKLVPCVAVSVTKRDERFAVNTERGDAIDATHLVLATGNEVKPATSPVERVLQTPWASGALAQAAKEQGPILLIGTGLTAVDMVLALRAEGYQGEIIAYSRNGLLPQAHRDYGPAQALGANEVQALQTLRQWSGWLRRATRNASDWRAVIDGLRPFTQSA